MKKLLLLVGLLLLLTNTVKAEIFSFGDDYIFFKGNCTDLNSKDFYNVKFCSSIGFFYWSKKTESKKLVLDRAKEIALKVCPGGTVKFDKKIKLGNIFLAGINDGYIYCKNSKKLIEEVRLKKKEEVEEARLKAKKEKEKKEKENSEKQPIITFKDQTTIVAASSGTGFFVSTNGHMVTNYHVIKACDGIKAHYKGKEIDADVLFKDRANDLAIIKANIKPKKVFSISNEDVSLLEDIIVAGYPLGKKISASIKTSKGSVTALAGYGDNFSNFQIDAVLNSGNSGGPIMDQKGNIVGVAVAKYIEDGVEGFNFGVKSSMLKVFASSNQFKFEPTSTEELSNKELGQLITEATIYLECWMSVAKIKQIIQEGERQKAFFSEFK